MNFPQTVKQKCSHNGVLSPVDNCPQCGVQTITYFNTTRKEWETAEELNKRILGACRNDKNHMEELSK